MRLATLADSARFRGRTARWTRSPGGA